MVDAFVSHASQDAEQAHAVAAALEAAGFSVWWDRHLLAGQQFQQEIQDQLAAAAAVVVLWTPASVRSEWVYSEARRGHQRGALVQLRTRDVGIDDLPAPFDARHCPFVDDTEALQRAVAALARTPAQPVGSTRERKVVAVLAAELEPEDDLDPEDLDELAPELLAKVHAEVAEYGGTWAAEPGLTVTATFGADRAHEDDPLRAVYTALAVQEVLRGSGFGARIGIAAGEALVTGGATVSGTVTAAARRLREGVAVGGVLVDETTEAATRRYVEYDEERRALAVRGSAGAELADALTPMVGRDDELAQLQRSYLRAVRDGSVQLVTLIGDPGLGKSRLVQAFSDWVEERDELVVWRQGRCQPFGGSAYAALGELVRSHAGIRSDDPADTVRGRLTEAVEALVAGTDLAGRESWLVDRLAPLVGLPADEAGQEELFAAWSQFVGALAYDGPAVLVLEDLHWAEPAMLDFVSDLLQHTSGLPLLVVATARPELLDRSPSWGGGRRNATTLALTPLTGAELTELLEGMSADDPLPDELAVALLSQSGGNPLYAREFLSLYRSRGGDLDPAELPGSVRAVVAARLDTLAGHAKRVLQAAAVVGHTFWSGTVASLNQEPADEVEPELRDLTGRELLRRAHRSRIQGESEFAFAHALFADVALASLPRADRVRLFRAAAEWHAARIPHPESSDRTPMVAHLYGQAHAATSSSAEDRAELAELAATWHGHAARYVEHLDGRTWLRHAQEAVTLTGPDHPELARRLHDLGHAQAAMSEHTAAELTFRSVARAAEASGDEVLHGEVLVRLSRLLEHLARSEEAEAALMRGVELLERHPAGPPMVEALITLNRLQLLLGRLGPAVAASNRALELAERLDLRDTVATALLERGESRLWSNDLGGRDDLARGEAAALDSGQPGLVVQAHRAQGLAAALFDTHAEAVRRFELGLDIAERTGHRSLAVLVANQLAEAQIQAGRLDDAVEVCRSWIERTDEQGNPGHVADLRATQAWALTARGDLDEAAELLALALPVSRLAVASWLVGVLLTDAERARLATPDAPNPSAEELAALLEGPELGDAEPDFLERVARLYAADRPALVERYLTGPSPELPYSRHGWTATRAALAEARGAHEEALELHLDAAAGWAHHGVVLERLHSLLGAARCCVATGRPADAHLAEVRDVATAIGARPLAAEAAALGS